MTFLDVVSFEQEDEKIYGMIIRLRPKWPREGQEYIVLTDTGKEFIVQEKDLTFYGSGTLVWKEMEYGVGKWT